MTPTISQCQSKRALRPMRNERAKSRSGEPRSARADARHDEQEQARHRASASSDDAELGERLHVERVRITHDERGRVVARTTGTRTSPRRSRRAAARGLQSQATRSCSLLPLPEMLKSRSLRSTSPTAGSASNRSSRPSSARTGPPAADETETNRNHRQGASATSKPLRAPPGNGDAPGDCTCCPCERADGRCDRDADDRSNAMPIALRRRRAARSRSSAHRSETRTRCTRRMAARRRSMSRAVAAAAGPARARRRSRSRALPTRRART